MVNIAMKLLFLCLIFLTCFKFILFCSVVCNLQMALNPFATRQGINK